MCKANVITTTLRKQHLKYVCTQHRSTKIYKANINELKEKINSNTIIVGDIDTPLIAIDTPSRQKINKKTSALNDILDLM